MRWSGAPARSTFFRSLPAVDRIYQGTTATPGSVLPRRDARMLQDRLYYEVNYQVFTDGILHQFDLQQDAAVFLGLPPQRPKTESPGTPRPCPANVARAECPLNHVG